MCLLIDSTVHLTIQSHNLSLKVQEFLVLVVAFKMSGGMGVVFGRGTFWRLKKGNLQEKNRSK